MIFKNHKTFFCFMLYSFKNVKPILSSWAVQKVGKVRFGPRATLCQPLLSKMKWRLESISTAQHIPLRDLLFPKLYNLVDFFCKNQINDCFQNSTHWHCHRPYLSQFALPFVPHFLPKSPVSAPLLRSTRPDGRMGSPENTPWPWVWGEPRPHKMAPLLSS